MKRCFLIGKGIQHSLSPLMHNANFKKERLEIKYSLKDINFDELEETVNSLRDKNVIGANVTSPYKISVIQYLDSIDPVAEKIGAVNTIVNNNGKLKGYNTDWIGITKSVGSVKGKEIYVLGAGGASRAVIYALMKQGGKVTVVNRTLERAKQLAEEFGCDYSESVKGGDIIINCAPVCLVGKDVLSKFSVAVDIVYTPSETQFLQDAKEAGCSVVPGLRMLVYQALESFYLWTGVEGDIVEMQASL